MDSKSKSFEKQIMPAFLVPDHFLCNQHTTMVAIYNEPLASETDSIMLMFPGNNSGSSPQWVTARRIGSQTLVFDTPIYAMNRSSVEVQPHLYFPNGQIMQLSPFKLSLKHPLTNIMELCMSLSTSKAVLPVLLSLIIHSDKNTSKEYFMDPHTDRMMSMLVASMNPGPSVAIKDILIPLKKWKKTSLVDLAREIGLKNVEKECYMLNVRRKPFKIKSKKTRNVCFLDNSLLSDPPECEDSDDHHGRQFVESGLYPNLTDPPIASHDDKFETETDEISMHDQMLIDKKRAYEVIEDFSSHDPSKLSLKVGNRVYVVTLMTTESGWWYGACNKRHGYFPAHCVKSLHELEEPEVHDDPHLVRNVRLPTIPKRQTLSIPANKAGAQDVVQKQSPRLQFMREHLKNAVQPNTSNAVQSMHSIHDTPESDIDYEEMASLLSSECSTDSDSCSEDHNEQTSQQLSGQQIHINKTSQQPYGPVSSSQQTLIKKKLLPNIPSQQTLIKRKPLPNIPVPKVLIKTTNQNENSKPLKLSFSPDGRLSNQGRPSDARFSNQSKPRPPLREESLSSTAGSKKQFVQPSERQHLKSVEVIHTKAYAVNDVSVNENYNSDDGGCPDYVNMDPNDVQFSRDCYPSNSECIKEEYDEVGGHMYDLPILPSYITDTSTSLMGSSCLNQSHSPCKGSNMGATDLQLGNRSRPKFTEVTPRTKQPTIPVPLPPRCGFDKSRAITLSPTESRRTMTSNSRFRLGQNI